MAQFFEVFSKYPNFVLATVDADGKPHARIVQYLFEIDNEFYFCTNNTKNMSKQMKGNKNVSMLAYAPDYSAMARVNGKVKFVDNLELKKRALDENPGIKSIYKEAQNPIFEICVVSEFEVE